MIQRTAELQESIAFAKANRFLVATADRRGRPHIAAGEHIAEDRGAVVISEFFCPRTVANLSQNRHVSVATWDPVEDHGFLMSGEVTEFVVEGMLDGYLGGGDDRVVAPQVLRKMVVRVDEVGVFRTGTHADTDMR